jgi:hypothetical protein
VNNRYHTMTILQRDRNLTGVVGRRSTVTVTITALFCIVCACRLAVVESFIGGRAGGSKGGNALLSRPRSIFSSPSFGQPSLAETSSSTSSTARRMFSSDNDADAEDTAEEAVQSLANFHVGSWRGTAQSFGVSADVAAGILLRRKSLPYTVDVTLTSKDAWQETMEWMPSPDTASDTSTIPEPSVRSINFAASNMDVDAVDASYSLDVTLPDLSSTLVGSDQLQQFLVEHCIAVSDNHRSRLLALYSATDQSLLRVVVCEETRMVPVNKSENDDTKEVTASDSKLTMAELVEMQADVDRLVDKIVGQVEQPPEGSNDSLSESKSASESSTADLISSLSSSASLSSSQHQQKQPMMQPYSSDDENANGLLPHTISLLELSSGLWLGDAMVRDMSSSLSASSSASAGKGFGGSSSNSSASASKQSSTTFGSWSVGVQKVAWRWMWNFGEEIRQIIDAGKTMGTAMVVHSPSTAGSVCVNESLSRRIKKEDRMVYVDWTGDNVGFLVGSVSIQVCTSVQ